MWYTRRRLMYTADAVNAVPRVARVAAADAFNSRVVLGAVSIKKL